MSECHRSFRFTEEIAHTCTHTDKPVVLVLTSTARVCTLYTWTLMTRKLRRTDA